MVAKLLRIGIIQRGYAALDQWPRSAVLGLSLALVFGLGLVEYCLGNDLSFLAFYLFPIVITTWFVGLSAGVAIALLSSIITVVAQLQSNADPAAMVPLAWNAVILGGVGGVVADLLHRVKVADAIGHELSRIDAATGAINRRFFLELLEAEFHRAERYHFPLTLAYINLNNLNQINEKLGHQSSDELLYHFVEQLSQTLRANDVVARLGGNEFALLLPQTNDTQAQKAFERLQPHLKATLEADPVPLEYSVGVTTFLGMPETLEELTEKTDQFLKRMKGIGKNRLEYQVID
jgi:diguanylate cyclase (GGDEF)-like protein